MIRLIKHVLFSAVIAAGVTSCSEDPAPAPAADTTEAREQGRNDAKALSEARFTTERDLHAALLSVKAREWKLRRSGDTPGAEAYVDAFRKYLEETDSELADKVF